MNWGKGAITVVALATGSGCQQEAPIAEGRTAEQHEQLEQALDGYGNLKFGMTFDEAFGVTGAYPYNPASVKGCMIELPIRGCILFPDNNLVPYRTIDGIPYGLSLSFNRLNNLTDISLRFARETIDDPDQEISSDDCLAMHERTLDWLVKEFGPFEHKHDADIPMLKSPGGNTYPLHRDGETFVASAERKLQNGRTIFIMSSYIVTGERACNVQADFKEPDAIERWEMSPEDQAEYERITG